MQGPVQASARIKSVPFLPAVARIDLADQNLQTAATPKMSAHLSQQLSMSQILPARPLMGAS